MREMSIAEIVKAVKAIDYSSSDRFATVCNVQFDSRLCQKNSLFIPLKGQVDGHDFVQSAIDNGATVTLWDRPQDTAPDNIACIFVEDTLRAFQDLAHYFIASSQMKVIGITGSNGKTTTKDMIASVLATQYNVYKTQGNYNNEIGLPKTVLDAPENTEILVLEMGMDGFGQIEELSHIANPIVSVITLIGDSHLEFLKSREGIAKAKLEIVKGMSDSGVLIVPGDEPLLAHVDKTMTCLTFGTNESDTVTITNVVSFADSTTFQLTQHPDVTFTIPVIGEYNARNAASAILVAQQFHVRLENIVKGLAQFELTANRTQWIKGKKGTHILNDAYNASPTSMRAILKDFQKLEKPGRKILVLGDMRELGENADVLHASLHESIDKKIVAHVFLFGEHMAALYEELLKKDIPTTYEASKQDEFIKKIQTFVYKSDNILVKSSFGTKLLNVVKALSE